MKKKLNKWQIGFNYGEDFQYHQPFIRRIDFGIVKLTSLPEVGEPITKNHYKGFMIAVEFYIPIRIVK